MNAPQQKVYEQYWASPPTGRGNGLAAAYWRGSNGVPNHYDRQSLAWAAWKAGKDSK